MVEKTTLLLLLSAVGLGIGGVLYWKLSEKQSIHRFTEPAPIAMTRETVDRWLKDTETKFQRAFKLSHVKKYVYVYVGILLLSFIISLQMFKNPLASGVITWSMVMLPQYLSGVIDDRRIKKTEEQLPLAIRFFKTQYNQTKSIEKGLSTVALRVPNPVGSVFAEAHFNYLAGYSSETIFQKMAKSLKSHYGIMLVQILQQIQHNGKAVELLEELASKVENHLEITREHHANISIERLAFLILVLTPFPLYLVCQFIVPEIRTFITETLFGKMVIASTFISFGLWILADGRLRKVE